MENQQENLIEGEYDGAPLDNKTLYELIFADMTEEDQKEFAGKPLFWNNGIWVYPDGTIKRDNKP